MYFTATVSNAFGAISWTETVLVTAIDEAHASSYVTHTLLNRTVGESTLKAKLQSITKITKLEYQVLNRHLNMLTATGWEPALPREDEPSLFATIIGRQVATIAANIGAEVDEVDFAKLVDYLLPKEAAEAVDVAGYDDAGYEVPLNIPIVEEAVLFGPRIEAVFQPQAMMDNIPVNIDGAVPVDVTAEVLNLDLLTLNLLTDGDEVTGDFVSVIDFDHHGPYRVVVEEAIRQFFEVANLSQITNEMLQRARKRAFENEAVDVIRQPQYILPIDCAPLSAAQMAKVGWSLDCIVPLPSDYPHNYSQVRAYVSTILTGRVYAMEDIQYSDFEHDYGEEYLAIRVRGVINKPEQFFEHASDFLEEFDAEATLHLARTIASSDVCELSNLGSHIRYHIVATRHDLVEKMLRFTEISREEWHEIRGRGIIELIDPDTQEHHEDGLWLTMQQLASVKYDQGTFIFALNDAPAELRFF